MEEIKRLRKHWPSMTITDLQGHGANLSTAFGIITVYWKKQKFCINNAWQKYSTLGEFISIVDSYLAKSIKTFRVEDNEPTATHGVQDVIDHINRKIEFGRKNGMSNNGLTLLITLVEELKQYL